MKSQERGTPTLQVFSGVLQAASGGDPSFAPTHLDVPCTRPTCSVASGLALGSYALSEVRLRSGMGTDLAFLLDVCSYVVVFGMWAVRRRGRRRGGGGGGGGSEPREIHGNYSVFFASGFVGARSLSNKCLENLCICSVFCVSTVQSAAIYSFSGLRDMGGFLDDIVFRAAALKKVFLHSLCRRLPCQKLQYLYLVGQRVPTATASFQPMHN